MTLLLGGALCLLTAVITYVLPGRYLAGQSRSLDNDEVIAMEENAEIAGAGLMLADTRTEGQPS